MATNPKIVQLKQLLSERFPGARFSAEPVDPSTRVWPTGITQIDQLLHGGLPKSAITELVCERKGSGSGLLISALFRKSAKENQIFTLIDGQDSFDPTPFAQSSLSRLLWVRCRDASQALRAADLILRDGNLSLVVLDLALNSEQQLRKIPASTWYRLQRIVETTSAILAVVTPRAMVGCARARLNLHNRFALEDLNTTHNRLLAQLKTDLVQHRLHIAQSPERKTAQAG